MVKCKRCGKGGLFFKVNGDGLCKKCELAELEVQIADKEKLLADAKNAAKSQAQRELEADFAKLETESAKVKSELLDATARRDTLLVQNAEAQKNLDAMVRRTERLKPIAKSIKAAYEEWLATDAPAAAVERIGSMSLDELLPDPELNCLTMKVLRSRYNGLRKQVLKLCEDYEKRYTTKANAALYKLMVLALQAELENILYKLQFGKLEVGIQAVRELTSKYYAIAADGNQSIAPTLKRFIGQLESLYLEIVQTEYEYYVQRERAKEEQRAIKEQMRQEAEERKRLEQERKKVEAEEKKYQQEMERIRQEMAEAHDAELEKLRKRLEELTGLLNLVEEKKAEIINLQNGKAGTVYVISNIGSFGDHVFKIGMTRRLEPQDRINELSCASVPFPFDVHSFIFSQDAVALEAALHKELNNRRVNKVNLRKEFFDVSVEELQAIVERIDPTAPFRVTALAEQYRQSLSITDVPEEGAIIVDDEEEDEAV